MYFVTIGISTLDYVYVMCPRNFSCILVLSIPTLLCISSYNELSI